jgi:Methyltransferase FkbM domain
VADFIKMDVQGFEGHVIRGGKAFLRRGTPTLLMEFWPEGLGNAGTDPERLLRDLTDIGYGIVSPEGVADSREPEQVVREAAGESGKGFVNLLLKAAPRQA